MNTTQSKTQVPAKASTFQMVTRLATALCLATLLVPSVSAQYIYVANAGEDTVSKIDINNNTEVARYATWFTAPGSPGYVTPPHYYGLGPAPSRLLEDQAGNLFVLNRFFDPAHSPVLVKIMPNGGTPATTSTGPVPKALLDTGTTNDEIDPGDTKDARIQWGKKVGPPGALGRALCMDTTGVLWVGMYNTQQYYKVDAITGNTIAGPISVGHRPYGCQVDAKGTLWSIGANNQLVEINTSTNQVTPRPYAGINYSLSLFNGCASGPSKIYLSDRAATYIAYDPLATAFTAAPLLSTEQFLSLSVGVDSNGDIVSGKNSGGRVIKTNPSGSLVWDTDAVGSTVAISDLHGLIVDQHNDVWAVDLNGNQVVKYSGGNGSFIKAVAVGVYPYTYGNPPPPTCPCAVTSEPQIKCEKKNDKGEWIYSWSFVVTNNSPFSMPATTVDISAPTGSPITGLTPQQFTFQNPLPPKGHATVTGTFTLAQPIPGTNICFDIRLNAGDGWCCPLEHVCFIVPDCACASLQGQFECNHGQKVLQLSVTNLGPTAAAGAQIFSNTPGVTVSPTSTTLAFPQNIPVIITPLTVTGATPGQLISLSVMLHGPIDPKTGVNSWCCTATVKVTYPAKLCWWLPGGQIFEDVNANGIRDSGENGLPEWTVTLIDAKGTPHTTKSDASGKYQFEEIEPAKYRLSVQPPKGWRATTSKGGVNSLSVEAPPKENLDFGFTKTR